ncbi:hypothetical protein M184_gp61 [Mycobacterium phage WIVsmall]|uniref:hypothetical protein n=1 Tax=Mycobacterium phage WIVsmall TaxID=1327036 RepID=UPI00032B91D3|nr:hypothetical protein M184_gp61 [Mycobacterium phage WIVsmall]AGK88196.1 hypothetical protein WIVsmall_61 [Mycobacterium phage WIVsmall]
MTGGTTTNDFSTPGTRSPASAPIAGACTVAPNVIDGSCSSAVASISGASTAGASEASTYGSKSSASASMIGAVNDAPEETSGVGMVPVAPRMRGVTTLPEAIVGSHKSIPVAVIAGGEMPAPAATVGAAASASASMCAASTTVLTPGAGVGISTLTWNGGTDATTDEVSVGARSSADASRASGDTPVVAVISGGQTPSCPNTIGSSYGNPLTGMRAFMTGASTITPPSGVGACISASDSIAGGSTVMSSPMMTVGACNSDVASAIAASTRVTNSAGSRVACPFIAGRALKVVGKVNGNCTSGTAGTRTTAPDVAVGSGRTATAVIGGQETFLTPTQPVSCSRVISSSASNHPLIGWRVYAGGFGVQGNLYLVCRELQQPPISENEVVAEECGHRIAVAGTAIVVHLEPPRGFVFADVPDVDLTAPLQGIFAGKFTKNLQHLLGAIQMDWPSTKHCQFTRPPML